MNEDAPSVTVHPLMWADDPEHPDDDYLAAVFTTEQGLRDYVADVALQGVTIVGAHQHPPVQLLGLPGDPATAPRPPVDVPELDPDLVALAARAVWNVRVDPRGWDDLTERDRVIYCEMARAAIDTYREVTR
jgi:hypothetical protein